MEMLKTEKALDPATVEFIRQVTLYKMQRDLWILYEFEWHKFKIKDHLTAKAPIPPNTRVLTLHLYLVESGKSISEIRSLTELAIDAHIFQRLHREAKRRL